MENRQLITLGSRNKSLSKLKATIHSQHQQKEPCYTSRVPNQPNPVSQPFRLIQTIPSKENLSSSIRHAPHIPVQHGSVLRENHTLSHQNFYMQSPQSKIVQSKEKTRINIMNENMHTKTRQGSPVNHSNSRSKFVQNQSNKNLLSLTLNQNAKQMQLISKIKILQQALSQKQAEQQRLQSVILHERNENHHLMAVNHKLMRENQQHMLRISQLEQMLEREISKSLELMDNSESVSKEIEDVRAEILVKDTLVKTLQEELKISHERITYLSSHIQNMRRDFDSKFDSVANEVETVKKESESKIQELEAMLYKMQSDLQAVSQLSAQKDSLIVQQEKKHQSELQNLIQQKQSKESELSLAIQTQASQLVTLQSQIQSLNKSQQRFFSNKQRSQSQAEKSQCKKCKQLLQTVFRLNSHLNKK